MKIGVLGTGMVGEAIASRLVELGHEVKMGARSADNARAAAWRARHGERAGAGAFADAAAFGQVVFVCTNGQATLGAIHMAGVANFDGKTVIDVTNPLDFSKGMPPTLTVINDDSLGEQVQRALPKAHVVKSLNTMNANLMVNPALLAGDHSVFVSGNSAEAKAQAAALLREFGWKDANIIDVGDITTARGAEQLVSLWVRLFGALGTPLFNFHIVR